MHGTDIQEGPPTNDQLNNILEYVGSAKVGSVVSGASDISDAMRKFKASEKAFQRPVVVDWGNGRAGMCYPVAEWRSQTIFGQAY